MPKNSGDGKLSFATIAGICLPFACAGFLYLPGELQPASWPGGDVRLMLVIGSLTMYTLATYRLRDGYQVTDGIVMGLLVTAELVALGVYNQSLSEIISMMGLPSPQTKGAFVRGWWLFVAQALAITVAFIIYNARAAFKLRKDLKEAKDAQNDVEPEPPAKVVVTKKPTLTLRRMSVIALLIGGLLLWVNWETVFPSSPAQRTGTTKTKVDATMSISGMLEKAKAGLNSFFNTGTNPTSTPSTLPIPQPTAPAAVAPVNSTTVPIQLKAAEPVVDIRVSGVSTGTLTLQNKSFPIDVTVARIPKRMLGGGWTWVTIEPTGGETYKCQISTLELNCYPPPQQ